MYSLIKFKIHIAVCQCDSDFAQNQLATILKSTHENLTVCQQAVPVTNACVAKMKTSCEML